MSPVLADDDTRGDFAHDTDNDASVVISWYDSTTLIDPNADVLFYTVANDIDNTSTEIEITLYYSDDTFATHNASYSMSFAYSPSVYHFRFTKLFPGEPAGTYYQYYFQVYDGTSYVRKPNPEPGIYFDIQWDAAPSDNDPAPSPDNPDDTETTEEELTEEIINIIIEDDGTLILILIIVLLFLTALLLVNRRREESKKQR